MAKKTGKIESLPMYDIMALIYAVDQTQVIMATLKAVK